MAKERLTKAQKKEKIAYQLYQNRQLLNRSGNSDSDWQTAGEIFAKPYKRFFFASHTRLIALEKRVWEPLERWANNQALISLLGLVGNIGILIAVASYVGSEKQRREAEVLNAWQTLTSAYGQSGSGGRIQALEFLNASPGANWRRRFPWFCAPLSLCTWPAESLAGINLATDDGTGVYLREINLLRADLRDANLEGADLKHANLLKADLRDANLKEASLTFANLEGADLKGANLERGSLSSTNLKGADLEHANLKEASLSFANLKGADLKGTNLERAYLPEVDLEGAYLWVVNLEGAYLKPANLEGAYLWSANLAGADLEHANLEGANLSFAKLKWANLSFVNLEEALLCNTALPAGMDLDPNRDCDILGIEIESP